MIDFEPILPPVETRAQQLAHHLVKDSGARSDTAEALAELVVARVQWVESGAACVIGLDGHADPYTSVSDLIESFRKEHPGMFAGGPVTAEPKTLTEKVKAEHLARQAAAPSSAADRGNPYAASTRNLTEQVRLEARDPDRAAKLKASAGV